MCRLHIDSGSPWHSGRASNVISRAHTALVHRQGEKKLPVAWLTSCDLFAGMTPQPVCVMWPPGPLMPVRMLEPFVCAIGIMVSCPVGVFLLGRRIDDPRNVAGAGSHGQRRSCCFPEGEGGSR
jgi:hypothetical protein